MLPIRAVCLLFRPFHHQLIALHAIPITLWPHSAEGGRLSSVSILLKATAQQLISVALPQEKLNSMMGKSSGFIETLPRQMRARIEFLRELQDKHDDVAEDYSKELKALREKYEGLYGAPSGQIFSIQP